jgi:hypothetical protein
MKLEYFEIDRVIEELSRNYAAPCTTTWFKVSENKRPSKEEYRKKVIEFMKHLNILFQTIIRTMLRKSNFQIMLKEDYKRQFIA